MTIACLKPLIGMSVARLVAMFASAFLIWPSQVNAAPAPFTGVWQIKWCDKDPGRECGRFDLYLVQTRSRICGDHFYMTLGMGKINEGGARSVVGTVTGAAAMLTITSGRDGSVFRARAKHVGKKLDWQVMEQLTGDGNDDSLIFEKASLMKIDDDNGALQRASAECILH